MLVLSRQVEGEIIIDERIVVKVISIRGDVVRLGIDAPREMSIRRGELEPRGAYPNKGGRIH